MRPMTSDLRPDRSADVVESFLDALSELATAAGAPVAAWVRERMRRARSQGEPSGGRLSEKWSYQIHGAGCAFFHRDGREVDVDLDDSDPAELTFDVWRLSRHARSIGLTAPDTSLMAELDSKVVEGRLTRSQEGWWVLPA